MSKLIPGNQKHLTLEDRLYIQKSLDEGLSFKDIAKFLCKDPTTISKEVRLHRSTNTWNKGSFTNPYNFCVHRFRCKRTNVCEKLFSVTRSVLPVISAIRSANALKRNSAAGSTRLPTSATAVLSRSTVVRFLTNTITMPTLPTANTRNFVLHPGKESTRPERRSVR